MIELRDRILCEVGRVGGDERLIHFIEEEFKRFEERHRERIFATTSGMLKTSFQKRMDKWGNYQVGNGKVGDVNDEI